MGAAHTSGLAPGPQGERVTLLARKITQLVKLLMLLTCWLLPGLLGGAGGRAEDDGEPGGTQVQVGCTDSNIIIRLSEPAG